MVNMKILMMLTPDVAGIAVCVRVWLVVLVVCVCDSHFLVSCFTQQN